jgi:hypothetical protein
LQTVAIDQKRNRFGTAAAVDRPPCRSLVPGAAVRLLRAGARIVYGAAVASSEMPMTFTSRSLPLFKSRTGCEGRTGKLPRAFGLSVLIRACLRLRLLG